MARQNAKAKAAPKTAPRTLTPFQRKMIVKRHYAKLYFEAHRNERSVEDNALRTWAHANRATLPRCPQG